MLGKSLCGTTAPLMGRDRTSDVTSPRYLHLRRRPSVWGVGGALTRHVSHVCSTGIQRDPCCGPLERVRMLLSVEWRISQLVERDLIRLRESRGHQAHAPNPLQCGQRPRQHERHVRGCHLLLTSNWLGNWSSLILYIFTLRSGYLVTCPLFSSLDANPPCGREGG